MDWQPIETAPQDGTAVLLWGDPCSFERAIFIGRFRRFPNGAEHWQTFDQADLEPTHWMPLPAPPHKDLPDDRAWNDALEAEDREEASGSPQPAARSSR